MTKKKVFLIAVAVCLVAILSMGTLAWFSDSDNAVNNFYVADSENNDSGDEVFSLDVYEFTEDSPTTPVPSEEDYLEILPGDTLKKEPHVANTGFYDQYIRVIVTVSDASNWADILKTDFNDATLMGCFDGFDINMWNNITTEYNEDENVVRIVMYYNGILDGTDTANDAESGTTSNITVFNSVKIPSAMTQAQAAAFGDDGFSITVRAQAVQTENVTPNNGGAFEAFGFVQMGIND